jgi:hypothetical protein
MHVLPGDHVSVSRSVRLLDGKQLSTSLLLLATIAKDVL